MKPLKTAPQILEHYLGYRLSDIGLLEESILKAMRHYNRTKIENLKDKLREEVKDEMYEEAYQNIRKQYNLD
jgi:protein-arginine kinase activator protein McsA